MATANQVSQLFVSLYNRAIDGVTAQQYSGRAYNAQLVNNIIADNGGVTETGRAFIERLYKNALGKNLAMTSMESPIGPTKPKARCSTKPQAHTKPQRASNHGAAAILCSDSLAASMRGILMAR